MTIAKRMLGSAVLLAALSLPLQAAEPVKVGSKIDTEGALLGNIILQVLESHGVKTVSFPIDVDALKFWNQQMKYDAEPGKFNVFIGVDSARVNKGEFELL